MKTRIELSDSSTKLTATNVQAGLTQNLQTSGKMMILSSNQHGFR